VSVACTAIVSTGPTGTAICSDGTGAPVAWVNTVEFDISQLDGPTLTGAFAIGFMTIGTCWMIGKAIGTVLKAVKNF
jgi:hypothetical protein